MTTVGFIGLGSMGGAIARTLNRSDVQLLVYDKNPQAAQGLVDEGARAAEELGQFADCQFVLICLPGPPEFLDIVTGDAGLSSILNRGSLVIDLTTNQPSAVKRAAEVLQEAGLHLVDAPVSGGVPGARDGTLSVAVGGSRADFESALPLLRHISNNVIHAGPLGAGDVCKLMNNMGMHAIRQILAEMFTVGMKSGVDPEKMFQFVSNGSFGRMDHLHLWLESRVFTGAFETEEPWFRHVLSHKDIRLAREAAADIQVPTPLGSVCLELAEAATDMGWGDRDSWVVFALQEERAGVQVRTERVDRKGLFDGPREIHG
jgi:3-hydroxyisobutyrate dehydrogenase-like beta-hydroxyacid dehydrogenase